MSCVVDASLALSWLFRDEQTPQRMKILQQVTELGAVVPSLWRLEIANALQASIKRRRIDVGYRELVLRRLELLPIEVDVETDQNAWHSTLLLSDRYGLTVYDASYLELAIRRSLPLATRDEDLARAARDAGLTLLPTS